MEKVETKSFFSKMHSNCIRGSAILIILVCHLMAVIFPSYIARLATPLGGIGVSAFLILSGYGLSYSYQHSLNDFWKKRMIGTIVPYTLIFLVILPFKLYSSWMDILFDYMTVKPIITYYWYIGYLMLWYLIFFAVKKVFASDSLQLFLMIVISIPMLIFWDSLRGEQSISFLIGCFIFKFKSYVERIFLRKTTIFLTFFVGVVSLALKQTAFVRNSPTMVFNFVQMLIKVPLAIFMIITIYYLIRLNWIKKLLDFLGSISYEVYLVHSVTILVLSAAIINKYIAIVIFLVATIVISILFNKLNVWIKKTFSRRRI